MTALGLAVPRPLLPTPHELTLPLPLKLLFIVDGCTHAICAHRTGLYSVHCDHI